MDKADVRPLEGRTPLTSQAGARERLEAAYKARGPELLAWAARRTGSREDAEDLLHDSFAAALKGIGELERIADPLGWIFTSLRNKAIDLWRMRDRRRETGANRVALETIEEIVAATGLGPAENLERDELSAALSDAIAALPTAQRQVIEAQALEGLTFREIAERTGLSIDTIAARKKYGVKKIARALRSWFED